MMSAEAPPTPTKSSEARPQESSTESENDTHLNGLIPLSTPYADEIKSKVRARRRARIMQYQEIDAFNRSEFQMFMEDLLSHGISILDIDADENMELEADAIGFTFSGPIVEESKGDSNAASAIDTEAEEKRQRIWAQYQSEIARQKQKVEINSGGSWTERSAIERYQALSKEFTQTRYGPETPLTLYSIPWPSLIYPNNMGLEDITWENTESFFARMRRLTYGNEYRKVLLNARRIFHPDRWRSRRLYDAIPDSDLRNAMEAVVTETSQAISALLPKE